MDQLRAIRVFLVVAESGSLGGAARRLVLSPASASRTLDDLETHLGVTLARRTTRALSLSDEGEAYLAACRSVIAAVDEADRSVSGARHEPRGHFSITAPVRFGKLHVAPLVLDFIAALTQTTRSLALLDRPVSLVDEGFDLAFRIGQLTAAQTVAVRLGTVRSVVCASPQYLASRRTPQAPQDLAVHDLIELSAMGAFGSPWSFSTGERDFQLRLSPRLIVSDTEVAVAAAVQGAGVIRILGYQVARHVAAGRLRIVLERFERPHQPVSMVVAAGRPTSAAVRCIRRHCAPSNRSCFAQEYSSTA